MKKIICLFLCLFNFLLVINIADQYAKQELIDVGGTFDIFDNYSDDNRIAVTFSSDIITADRFLDNIVTIADSNDSIVVCEYYGEDQRTFIRYIYSKENISVIRRRTATRSNCEKFM